MDEQSDAVATLTPPKPDEGLQIELDTSSIAEELRAAILRKVDPPE